MLSASDQQIHDFLVVLVTLVVVAYALFLLLRLLRRIRPELAIGTPISVAVGLRVFAVFGVGALGNASALRGGDENFFLASAHRISESAFLGPQWTDALTHSLFKFTFATQILAFDSTETALRIAQAGIAVAGLVLLAAAVYELAGPRAALIAAWALALEPTNIFFSTLLHKEPNLLLAGGLVAFGGACMWKRVDLRYLWTITLGCLIASATRPYVGWFLIAAGAAIALHVGIRARSQGGRSLTLVALVVLLAAVAAPTIWKASTHESLQENLQASQNANSGDSSNLSLERVDFSTRGAVIVNLPKRTVEMLTRPYPWQLGNASQQFGMIGTIFAWVCFWLLAGELWRARGNIMDRAGPLVYIGLAMVIAYSLSAGNAGTAFRYRTHIVAIAICLIATLREARLNAAPGRPQPGLLRENRRPAPSLVGT
jgi:hypothetical protein